MTSYNTVCYDKMTWAILHNVYLVFVLYILMLVLFKVYSRISALLSSLQQICVAVKTNGVDNMFSHKKNETTL